MNAVVVNLVGYGSRQISQTATSLWDCEVCKKIQRMVVNGAFMAIELGDGAVENPMKNAGANCVIIFAGIDDRRWYVKETVDEIANAMDNTRVVK